MNNYFQRALTTSRVFLVENIDYDNLKDYLVQYRILPDSILEDIDSLPNRRKKIREMLDCLVRRDDTTFPKFLISLFKSSQRHIANHLYQETANLIDLTDPQLKEGLDNDIASMLQSSAISLENNPTTSTTKFGLTSQHCNKAVENSVSSIGNPGPKPMESEEDYSFTNKGSENEASFLSNEGTLSFPSQQQSYSYNSAYEMDSNPRGLFCIITTKEGAELTGDSIPVFENKTSQTGNDALKFETELQRVFWDYGFHSCVVELGNCTFHPDKLNSTVYQFSQHPPHYRYSSCVMALLGFSESDLDLAKLLLCFNEKNCSSLVGKPKLFLIELPGDKLSPANLMSSVEIPEDSLVAVGMKKTDTQPGMVSSLIQVCRQMHKSSVEEIFSQVQRYSELKIAVKKSLTKKWIFDSHSKLQS